MVAMMSNSSTDRHFMRLTFLGLIAWLSVCLLAVGLFPHRMGSFASFYTIAGLFGLVSAVGLSEAVKSELRTHCELVTAYENQVRTDPLTGVGNRRAFDQDLNDMVPQWRAGQQCCLLLIDVDHFKSFNDEFGHQAGDEMLISLADILKSTTNGVGSASRYGGEEFAVCLSDTGLSEATAIAETLRELIVRHQFRYRDTDLAITISIGVAQARRDDGPKDLLMRADYRLYAAKKAGRNRVSVEQNDETESATASVEITRPRVQIST
jgi:diguanylate cyclase (GGDEF)-like protein